MNNPTHPQIESADLVIVGAGWHGISAAKAYLEVNPTHKIIIFDSSASIGGVWAKERLYRGLRTNNLLGSYEFSDLPMAEAQFGVRAGRHIPGDAVHAYLQAYVKESELGDKIRLRCKLMKAEYTDDKQWALTVDDGRAVDDSSTGGTACVIKTPRLILATGLTSQPSMPQLAGQDEFGAPIFHVRDLARYESKVLEEAAFVTVLGGTKSAWDTVYACASSGVSVDWVIRESGHGPAWMVPTFSAPFQRPMEDFVATRLTTLLSPCVWGEADGFCKVRRFLHGTWLGRKIVDAFWGIMGRQVNAVNRYEDHPETEKLRPWIHPFWVASTFNILNYPTDFFQYVREGLVRVHIADIARLSSRTVHLSNGDQIITTALVCCTGWRSTPDIEFVPANLAHQIGFPGSPDYLSEETVDRATQEILRRFPTLRSQPALNGNSIQRETAHPLRLTRFMVPPAFLQDRSLVLVGNLVSFATSMVAEVQGLWATAYFANRLSPTSPISALLSSTEVEGASNKAHEDIVWETALHTEFGKWRCPGGYGHLHPDFAFDLLPYLDLLLGDLGVSTRRKSSFWAHLFQPHGPRDYRGLVAEWKRLNGEASSDEDESMDEVH
ncbi:FAD/NAD(P)-binding domain-containing protein [Aspergillus campestris IBT 28561]|uniref:FAD/NAD(P)-binding domain-containing protein n=1 Tax=Aspergillus campestris (strain IBT 28561) TaxID=1392248 RepID=A0A2I1D7D3_ASPC2|nr:FAD/NAD(P)-binding domain-containing protein [Aspergillus campestris IBT 28561]PKY05785.1 FAD/NAD(P)-binding domain-containing protein [Aspergillus campestris IBT 28561]